MPDPVPRLTRRRLLLPALLLVHAALVLVAGRERLAAVPRSPAPIVVTEVAAAAPPSLPVEVKLFPVAAAIDAPELNEADAAEPPSTPTRLAQSGAGCDLSAAVEAGLRASPAATAALQRMPRAARSVADAVMLWDGHWINAGSVGGSGALDPIRAAVDTAVKAAPAGCRDALVTGPRLLIVGSATGNRILAFGSGQWTWAQLLAS